MKKHCSYRQTPHGIRISKHHIKRMPLLAEKDSIAGALDQPLLPSSSQAKVSLCVTGQPQPKKRKLEIIDFTGCKEVGPNGN